jgi:tetratricopeptide (TPR) repeat protein
MGRALAAQGRPQEAIAKLKQAVELSPRFGAAHYALALAYRDVADEASSQRHLRLHEQDKLGGPSPNDPLIAAVNALNTSQSELLQRAVDLEQSGDLDASIAEHLRALEQHPNLAQAHVNLVILYGRQRNYAEARKHYEAALSIEDRDAKLHYNFGVLAFDAERYSEAAEAFTRAVEIDPHYPEAQTNLGQLYEMQGRVDDAVGRYRQAIAIKPAHRLARYHLAQILLTRKQAKEAIEHLQWTLEPVDARTPQFYYALGAAYDQLGQRDEARRQIQHAKDLAVGFGQSELVARIDQVLSRLR